MYKQPDTCDPPVCPGSDMAYFVKKKWCQLLWRRLKCLPEDSLALHMVGESGGAAGTVR